MSPPDGGGMRGTAPLLAIAILLAPAADDAEVIDPLSAEALDLLDWAEARYESAGLEFPDVEVLVHDTTDPCRGRLGRYRRTDNGVSIHLCDLDGGDPDFTRHVVLHEFAHAWTAINLDANQIDAFLGLRGLEAWSSQEVAWDERGIEHAAEIIVWGINGRSHDLVSIDSGSDSELAIAFRYLTGLHPSTLA